MVGLRLFLFDHDVVIGSTTADHGGSDQRKDGLDCLDPGASGHLRLRSGQHAQHDQQSQNVHAKGQSELGGLDSRFRIRHISSPEVCPSILLPFSSALSSPHPTGSVTR